MSTGIDWDNHKTRSTYFQTERKSARAASVPQPTTMQTALRTINLGLRRTFGLEIRRPPKPRPPAVPVLAEDHCRVVSPDLVELRLEKLVEAVSGFFDALGIATEAGWLRDHITRYEAIFNDRPVQDLRFGTGYNNGLVIFCFFSALRPSQVIESGVWMGFSTYLLDHALPEDAAIDSFDITFERLAYRSGRARYFERDLTTVDFPVAADAVGFFDDHVSHYDRILYCQERGIRVIVLDDDVAAENVHCDGWPPVPTASMVMLYDAIPKTFEWRTEGTVFKADISGLDVSSIRDCYTYVRMPDLFGITGYRNSSLLSFLIAR